MLAYHYFDFQANARVLEYVKDIKVNTTCHPNYEAACRVAEICGENRPIIKS